MQTAMISEIFYSLSGEGITAGVPTVFVRFSGCSLRCGITGERKLWCDTPYALSPNVGEKMSIQAILQTIASLANPPYQLLLTGGEPLEGEKKKFCQELVKVVYQKRHNYYYEKPRVETSGKENLAGLDSMYFTMDYKLPGSGMEAEMDLDNFRILHERNEVMDEIKFVVRDRVDFERAEEIIKEFKLQRNLLFSPVEGECDPGELSEWIKKASIPGIRLSLQIHKILWGDIRGV